MRISDWSSDVCSSDLWSRWIGEPGAFLARTHDEGAALAAARRRTTPGTSSGRRDSGERLSARVLAETRPYGPSSPRAGAPAPTGSPTSSTSTRCARIRSRGSARLAEHTAEVQALMRIRYADVGVK